VLLYKKAYPTIIKNHKPITLANIIYKFFTSTITSQLANYGEKHQLLHDGQERFRQKRITSRQIQTIIVAFEDSKITKQYIFLLYIDFKNAFGFIDHARLSTIFTRTHFGKTKPVHIQRGAVQGGTLSPYLFIIFVEPLLRWLETGNYGYNLKASIYALNSTTYRDDLVILTNKLESLQPQINKIDRFCQWSRMDLGITNCAITGCSNNQYMPPRSFTGYIQTKNIKHRNQPISVLHQDESYTYLGIHLAPSLKWTIQKNITMAKLNKQVQQLL
jgi:hypothetical protein